MMKNNFKTFLPLLVLALCAGTAAAYTAPTGSAPSGNTPAPFTIGTTFDTKASGLNIADTFQAAGTATGGSAIFAQDLYVKGQINGGHAADTTSVVTIGSSTTATNLAINGTVTANTFKAESLLPASGSGYQTVVDTNTHKVLRKLCSDTNGKVSLCPVQSGGFCGNGIVNTGEDCDDKGATASCNADCTWHTVPSRTGGGWSNTAGASCYSGSGIYQCGATENCIANTCHAWLP